VTSKKPENNTKQINDQLAKSVSKLVDNPFSELSGIITDNLRYFRWKSAIKIMDKADKIKKERGFGDGAVPIKLLMPILEEGSKEQEDSEIIDLWANLLAMSCSETNSFDFTCIEILKQLTPTEANIIQNADILTEDIYLDSIATRLAALDQSVLTKFRSRFRHDDAYTLYNKYIKSDKYNEQLGEFITLLFAPDLLYYWSNMDIILASDGDVMEYTIVAERDFNIQGPILALKDLDLIRSQDYLLVHKLDLDPGESFQFKEYDPSLYEPNKRLSSVFVKGFALSTKGSLFRDRVQGG
jgi:hypothetical protein